MAKICADVTYRTSSKDLPQQAKKAALRLDMVRIHLGYCRNDNRNDFLHFNYLFLFFEKHIAFG
ncbi:MAG: hypothetical protein SOT09_02060 [Candidatus Borkfalkiaceae bacterium]|nr:hypothetical protein [Christensenellaceae bacterium]